MHRIGFLVNPIAGMGGKVGLKGTDGQVETAIKLGAMPVASERASDFFQHFSRLIPKTQHKDIQFITPPGVMGAEVVRKFWINYEVLSMSLGSPTTARDTQNAAKMLISSNVALIVFVGGDGTSIDIFREVGKAVPLLGIPSGVKMYGSVFARTPRDATTILQMFLASPNVQEAEIMDIDEAAYRDGRLSADLKGIVLIPFAPENMQVSKLASPVTTNEISAQQNIAQYIIDELKPNIYYILGPGGTVQRITELLSLPKTALGVDILKENRIIASDVNEAKILQIIENKSVKIIVTPLGHQGFLFGRGNQQISPQVIQKVGRDNIIVIATKNKLSSLPNRTLYVDTQDEDTDNLLRGYMRVITDYNEVFVLKVV
ncbi:MAG: ATP-NAD kinase family protein [Promethearchaeota archaeon]